MVKVGIAGVGFMGWIHWLAYQKLEGIQVVAVCSRDAKKRAGDWTSIQGNFGPPGEQVDLSTLAVYESLPEMLADSEIDLVDICLPPSLHCSAVCDSLRAGKHVLCEKPMALSTTDCDQMMQVAQESQRQLVVGHVLPYFPEFAFVRSLVASGEYGMLLGGEFKRTVSDPTWIQGFFDMQVAGGPLLDLTVHDSHFIRACFGMPTALYSSGSLRGETVEYCATVFDFEDPRLVVSSCGGVINQQGRPFTHGFEVRFEKATVQFEFAGFADSPESMPLKVLTSDGKVLRPELGDGDPVAAFVGELAEVRDVITSGQPSKILDGSLARDAIQICGAQAESVRTQKKVSL